jgi:G3E family GTPase
VVKRQIPVVIVAGFLGSGKTTLLNHLLTSSGGTRIGVVVNDFGAIGIDAMAVAGQVDSTVSMSNGCLCCAVDVGELDGLLDRLAKPGGQLDVIVIEASGLAEPQTLVRMVLASENKHITYGGLVLVVDAVEFDRVPELDKQLRIADLVVLNKIDRVAEPPELDTSAPVVRVEHGRVDPALLFDPRPKPVAVGQLSFDDLVEHHDHAHAAYESVSFTTDQPLNPTAFTEFLDARPAGLFRLKGFVYFGVTGHRQKFSVHTVGDFLRFERMPWEPDEPRTTQLVLIGSGIDAEATAKRLDGCVEPSPEDVDPQTMLEVLRYLRQA